MSDRPLRVLVLHSRYASGELSGENRVVDDEIALLRGGGHEVHSWTPAVDVGSPRHAATAARALWSRGSAAHVASLVRRHGIEVVHCHNLFPMLGPRVLSAAADAGAPVVLTLHNYRLMCLAGTLLRQGQTCEVCVGRLPWRGVVHRCYRGSAGASAVLATSVAVHRKAGTFGSVSRFLAVSGFLRDKYVEAGFSPATMAVKPNFAPAAERREGPGRYFLFLGRISPEKGLETLLAAWNGSLGPLVVAGDGPDAERLRASAASNELVEFRGAVPAGEVPALLAGARALLLPSRSYEGMPRTLVEAYAAGVPVVAAAMGALTELVVDGVTGVLVPAPDPDEWAAAIGRLCDDAESVRLGAGAHAAWRAEFSAEAALTVLQEIYTGIIPRRGYRPGQAMPMPDGDS